MQRRGLQRRAAVALVLMAVPGCRQVADLQSTSTHESPPSCGGFDEGDSACAVCTRQNCCDVSSACGSDAECETLYGCLSLCGDGDGACRVGCRTSHTSSLGDRAGALGSCQARACARECAFSCGGYVAPSEACAACSELKCCGEQSACAAEPECLPLGYCTQACKAGDADCSERCASSHAAGIEALQALGACQDTQCPESCGLPRGWECLGQPKEPATASFVTVRMRFNAPYNYGIVPAGLTVHLCEAFLPTCNVLNTDQTSAAGVVTFSNVPVPFKGYLEVAAGPDAQGNEFLSALLFAGTVRRDTYYPSIPVFTQQTRDIALAHGAELDGELGVIVIVAEDCTGSAAGGVSFQSSVAGTPYYFVDSIASTTATQTDWHGFWWGMGGFLDVPPGSVTLTATLASVGVTTSEAQVIVRKGAITLVDMQVTE